MTIPVTVRYRFFRAVENFIFTLLLRRSLRPYMEWACQEESIELMPAWNNFISVIGASIELIDVVIAASISIAMGKKPFTMSNVFCIRVFLRQYFPVYLPV
jgi:hypothetical protein